MRDIRFRGKCKRGYDYSEGDGWVYGSLLVKNGEYGIVRAQDIDMSPKTDDGFSEIDDFGFIPVIPETVGQFTGLYAKGKEIYEGDIIQGGKLQCNGNFTIDNSAGAIVHFSEGIFKCGGISLCSVNRTGEIIGNIHSKERVD